MDAGKIKIGPVFTSENRLRRGLAVTRDPIHSHTRGIFANSMLPWCSESDDRVGPGRDAGC